MTPVSRLALVLVSVAIGCSSVGAYVGDGGGITSHPLPSGWRLTVDVHDDDARDAIFARAFPLIESALPSAVEVPAPVISAGDRAAEFTWVPGGRPTMLPPSAHGPRIQDVSLLVGRFLDDGEPLAEIRFGVDRTGEQDRRQTPFPSPSRPHYYHLDPDVFRDVASLFMAPVGVPSK
jgi:hypothetical protein